MSDTVTFSGNTEDEVWQQITTSLASKTEDYQFHAEVNQAGRTVIIDVDIDLGGGFEGGYELTTFSSVVRPVNEFRFAIHHQNFIDEVGKFFGMEDIVIGYPEFDDKVVIKTNDAEKVRSIFSDEQVRRVFENMTEYTLGIVHYSVPDSEQKVPFLELQIEKGILQADILRSVYHVFYSVLEHI